MRFRFWLYVLVGSALVVAVLMTIYDQIIVEYGDDDSYLLGGATALVFWILTLATPFFLFDFFRWMRNRKGGITNWLVLAAVGVSFGTGFVLTRDWSMAWVIQGDIGVTFGPSEGLSVVIGLWCAVAVALIIWLGLPDRSNASTAE